MIELILTLILQYNFCAEVYEKISYQKPSEENLAVCSILIEESKNFNIDISLILATSWVESGLTLQEKPNPYKCVGPLQIKYQYWCPNKNNKITATKRDGLLKKCDLFYHGMRAFKYYIKKFKPLNKALCYYNNSTNKKCKKKYDYKSSYVLDVIKNRKKIRSILKKKIYKNL